MIQGHTPTTKFYDFYSLLDFAFDFDFGSDSNFHSDPSFDFNFNFGFGIGFDFSFSHKDDTSVTASSRTQLSHALYTKYPKGLTLIHRHAPKFQTGWCRQAILNEGRISCEVISSCYAYMH